MVAGVAAGTQVQRGRSARGPDQGGDGTWYRVRVTVDGKVRNGWMHEDVLR